MFSPACPSIVLYTLSLVSYVFVSARVHMRLALIKDLQHIVIYRYLGVIEEPQVGRIIQSLVWRDNGGYNDWLKSPIGHHSFVQLHVDVHYPSQHFSWCRKLSRDRQTEVMLGDMLSCDPIKRSCCLTWTTVRDCFSRLFVDEVGVVVRNTICDQNRRSGTMRLLALNYHTSGWNNTPYQMTHTLKQHHLLHTTDV